MPEAPSSTMFTYSMIHANNRNDQKKKNPQLPHLQLVACTWRSHATECHVSKRKKYYLWIETTSADECFVMLLLDQHCVGSQN